MSPRSRYLRFHAGTLLFKVPPAANEKEQAGMCRSLKNWFRCDGRLVEPETNVGTEIKIKHHLQCALLPVDAAKSDTLGL